MKGASILLYNHSSSIGHKYIIKSPLSLPFSRLNKASSSSLSSHGIFPWKLWSLCSFSEWSPGNPYPYLFCCEGLKLNTDLRFGLIRAKSEIVTPFLVMPLMQPSILLSFFDTEATVHSYRSCSPPGEWPYSAGKGRTEERVKTNCFSVLLVTESPLLFNSWLIFLLLFASLFLLVVDFLVFGGFCMFC